MSIVVGRRLRYSLRFIRIMAARCLREIRPGFLEVALKAKPVAKRFQN
jgi:hypothetical protein